MKIKGIFLAVVLMVLMSFSLASAIDGRVLIDGSGLIFRDANGNEQVWVPASTITPGTVTVTSGGGTPVTTTGTETLTNKTLTAPIVTTGTFANPVITDGTDTQIYVVNTSGIFVPVTVSGTIAITNGGVTSISTDLDADDIAANAIGASELNHTVVNVPIVSGQTSGTATVTAGSVILGMYAFANIDSEVANIVAISSTTLTVTINAAAAGASVIYRVVILEP